MSDAIFERVKDVIVDQLKVGAEEVTLNVSFDDLGADSLAKVEMVMAFEDKFSIEIPDDDAETINTVGQAVDYIRAHTTE